MRHRELALQDDVSDLPPPARDTAVDFERREQLVACRVDGAARPLVRREPPTRVADDEDGVECDEAYIRSDVPRTATTRSPW